MGNIQFGGVLGSFLDKSANRQVKTRCSGNATVAFDAPDDFKLAARASLMKQTTLELQRALDAGENMLALHQKAGLAAAVAAAVTAELGVPIQITLLQLGMGEEDMQALANAAPKPTAPTPRSCPSCGMPGAGKFCQGCGSAMVAAPPPPPPAATLVSPPPPTNYLTSPVNHPIAAGARVLVHANHCFVGFANGAIACNLQAGVHELPQACESGVYISLRGLPFALKVLAGDGWLELRGALFIQDPLLAFRDMMSIDDSTFGVLQVVLSRCTDKAFPNAADERQLCFATAQAYPLDGNNIKGTVVVLESMRPTER